MARRSAVDKVAVRASKAAIPGGALIPDAVYDKALGKAKKKAKWTFIKIVAITLALILLVMMIYLNNCYVDPNYLNVSAYLNRSYSRETTRGIIEAEKEYQSAVEDVTKTNQEDWSQHTFDPSTYTGGGALDPNRFTTAKGYIENYAQINTDLLAYVSSFCTFSIGNVDFDGIVYLAMCNDESVDWLRDNKQTVSSAFPSTIIDIDTVNYLGQFEQLNIGTIFTSPNAYGFTNGSYFMNSAWMMNGLEYGDVYNSDQGPSTSSFNEQNQGSFVSGRTNEVTIISSLKETIDTVSREPSISNNILATGTGSGRQYLDSIIANGGDRWNIQDSATVFAGNMKAYLPLYAQKYKELYNEEPRIYELLCFMQMQHWYGSGFTLFNKNCDHFKKPGAWNTLIIGVCSDSSLEIIQKYVDKALEESDCIVNPTKDSELVKEVLANIDSMGLEYSDGTTFNSSTDITDSQGRSEFINYIYNYMLLERIYSEGGSTAE